MSVGFYKFVGRGRLCGTTEQPYQERVRYAHRLRRPLTMLFCCSASQLSAAKQPFAKGLIHYWRVYCPANRQKRPPSMKAVVEKCNATDLYVGYILGFSNAHSQGESLDELNRNLREVIEMLQFGFSLTNKSDEDT